VSAPGSSLALHLARRIRTEGPLPLASWMAECLGNPHHGYYTTRDPLGVGGDFTTAPEISQAFGEMIGLWCADAWTRLGSPGRVLLVELGPGRGTLMADALRAARALPAFRAAVEPHLVETSPALRRRQAETLAQAAPDLRPAWHDRPEEVPDGPMLLVANEFLDALPVHQLEKRGGQWVERMVDLEDTAGAGEPRFRLVLAGWPSPLAGTVPEHLRGAPDGSVFELCPAAAAAADWIGRRLAREGGAALLIDYGHAVPAVGDTVQAVRRHAFAPVLEAPGEADLTAHVDFSAVTAAARAAGAAAFGPIGQGEFLVRLGIRERVRSLLARADERQAGDLVSGLRRLIDEARMGRLFKVLALAAPGSPPPAGFGP
jgi:NADH dehydrogenase [ubiquinone] 1 alpha subcomplex assembly factor 7